MLCSCMSFISTTHIQGINWGDCWGGKLVAYSKKNWKSLVKSKVRKHAFEALVKEAAEQKNPVAASSYLNMCQQPYLTDLPPADARRVFHLRTNTI